MSPVARRTPIPPLVVVLFVCELLLGAAYLLDWSIGRPSWTLTRVVDLDGEGNLPTWFSSVQLLLLGALFLVLAGPVATWRDRRRWPALALAAVAIGLSCEEVVQLHEWVSHTSDVLLPGGTRRGVVRVTGAWMFLLVPPFVLLVFAVWRRFRAALAGHEDIARRYRLGFTLYLLAIFGLELLVNATRGYRALMAAEVLAEELVEMAAVTVLIWATLDLLAARGIRLLFAPSFDDRLRKVS